MLLFWSIVALTISTLHWQFKFGKTGQTFKTICIATLYTVLMIPMFSYSKLLFTILFFYVTLALWMMVIVSIPITKHWAMDPKEEPYHH